MVVVEIRNRASYTKVSHLQLGNCLFRAEDLTSLHKGPQILGAASFNSLLPIQSGPVASEISEFVRILNTSKLEKSGSEIVICGRIGSGKIYVLVGSTVDWDIKRYQKQRL